ncbi:hypothetical protein [Mycoplasmopsis columbinasalis]|uniref:Uncharacterized protein n=1 Tax=Mycoplasmopsis columbinasalis TaxID=114880 RepID=A0A449BAY7_9BACT|nr:hypothetical protein [Mycoplasmopsis columbinasalis]VEU78344.1 Uncharacterised protein [Mycoplasmopsis columbinasalis]
MSVNILRKIPITTLIAGVAAVFKHFETKCKEQKLDFFLTRNESAAETEVKTKNLKGVVLVCFKVENLWHLAGLHYLDPIFKRLYGLRIKNKTNNKVVYSPDFSTYFDKLLINFYKKPVHSKKGLTYFTDKFLKTFLQENWAKFGLQKSKLRIKSPDYYFYNIKSRLLSFIQVMGKIIDTKNYGLKWYRCKLYNKVNVDYFVIENTLMKSKIALGIKQISTKQYRYHTFVPITVRFEVPLKQLREQIVYVNTTSYKFNMFP